MTNIFFCQYTLEGKISKTLTTNEVIVRALFLYFCCISKNLNVKIETNSDLYL